MKKIENKQSTSKIDLVKMQEKADNIFENTSSEDFEKWIENQKLIYTEEFPTVLASNIAKDIVNAEKVYIPTRYKIDKNKDYVLRKDVIATIKEMEGVDTKELIRVINLLTLHN